MIMREIYSSCYYPCKVKSLFFVFLTENQIIVFTIEA